MATHIMSRSLKRFALEVLAPVLPPAFLLPSRARYFNSTAHIVEPPSSTGLEGTETLPSSRIVATKPSALSTYTSTPRRQSPSAPPATPAAAGPLASSVRELLPLLHAQPNHFITAHIHARPYLLTAGDMVRLPFQMPGVVPGDVLRLNRASAVGSRDYTLKGAPYLDERIYECRATVVGTEGEPVRIKEKTKRRNRRVKTVRSKHKFTVLRISQLKVKSLEEIES